jgi:membrane peptidoglycan carboxypeptidase
VSRSNSRRPGKNSPRGRSRSASRRTRSVNPAIIRAKRSRQTNRFSLLARVFAIGLFGTLILLIIGIGVAAAAGISGWSYISNGLPNVNDPGTGTQFQTTKIYDRNWKLLTEVSDPNTGYRTAVSYQEILDHITQQQSDPNQPHQAWIFDATVAAEDSSFWTNKGVDPTAIARGVLINLTGSGSSGASTITQQLVRTLYPDQIGTEHSYTRKIREAITAYRFSQHYTKEQILEMYLNHVYYGNLSYGIDAASQAYFNKHPWNLTLGEASMLAGLPQAPSLYDPTQDYELARARQSYVLNQMVKQLMITRQQADDAYAEPLNPQTRASTANVAPHFVNYVKYYLEQKYGADVLYRGGLVVQTTLDLTMQNTAQQIVTDQVKTLAPYDADNGALVAILPSTGEIVAMVGSADYNNDAIDGQVNVAVRERQPGSSIKPITYLAAFEKGWNPGTVVFDYAKQWPTPGSPDPYYAPHNDTLQNFGAVSVRTALANSLNIPAVQALDYVGVTNMIDLEHKMGIQTGLWRGPSFYGLAITLGGGEVTPLEHTNVFATLANNGRFVPYTPVLKVTDSSGKVLYDLDRENALKDSQQVVKAEHAYQITSILTDNQARSMIFGTHTPLTLPELDNRPVAAKTGTTDDNRDTWTMGYTTDLAVGVWVGNTDNSPTRNLDGVQSAAPIWHDFMVKVHEDPEMSQTLLGADGKPVAPDFVIPPGIVNAPVCTATGGLPISGASTRIEVLVKGEGPTLKCNQATDDQRKDLQAALANAAKNPRFTHQGIASLQAYAALVGVRNSGFDRLLAPPTSAPEAQPTVNPKLTPTVAPGTTPTAGGQSGPTPITAPVPTQAPRPTPKPTSVPLPTAPSVPLIPTPSAQTGDGPYGPDESWRTFAVV